MLLMMMLMLMLLMLTLMLMLLLVMLLMMLYFHMGLFFIHINLLSSNFKHKSVGIGLVGRNINDFWLSLGGLILKAMSAELHLFLQLLFLCKIMVIVDFCKFSSKIISDFYWMSILLFFFRKYLHFCLGCLLFVVIIGHDTLLVYFFILSIAVLCFRSYRSLHIFQLIDNLYTIHEKCVQR